VAGTSEGSERANPHPTPPPHERTRSSSAPGPTVASPQSHVIADQKHRFVQGRRPTALADDLTTGDCGDRTSKTLSMLKAAILSESAITDMHHCDESRGRWCSVKIQAPLVSTVHRLGRNPSDPSLHAHLRKARQIGVLKRARSRLRPLDTSVGTCSPRTGCQRMAAWCPSGRVITKLARRYADHTSALQDIAIRGTHVRSPRAKAAMVVEPTGFCNPRHKECLAHARCGTHNHHNTPPSHDAS